MESIQYSFRVSQGPGSEGKIVSLKGEMWIGRGSSCHIQLNHPAVSRKHALLKVVDQAGSEGEAPQAVVLENQSEFSPLKVNGLLGKTFQLKPGDLIGIGPFSLEFHQQQLADQSKAQAEAFEKSPILVTASTEGSVPLQEESPAVFSEPLRETEADEKTAFVKVGGVSFQFFFQPEEANVLEYELKKQEAMIGRDPSCDLILQDKKASRRHALLKKKGTECFLEDLKSSNGTFVNEEKIDQKILENGDWIRIGSTQFQFKAIDLRYHEGEKHFLPISEDIFQQEENASAEGVSSVDSPSSTLPPLAGLPVTENKPRTLVERYRTLPPRTRILLILVVLVGGYFLLSEEDATPTKKGSQRNPASQKGSSKNASGSILEKTFEQLSPEQKQFVDSQHALAFELYKNKEYDRALFEIEKIFSLVSDYQDAREIKRYAQEGKKMMDLLNDQKKAEEKEKKKQMQLAVIIQEAQEAIDRKDLQTLEYKMIEIGSVDPENKMIFTWKKQLQEERDRVAQENQARIAKEAFLKNVQDQYQRAHQQEKKGAFYQAIEAYQKLFNLDLSKESEFFEKAKQGIARCREKLHALRQPFLDQGKKAEDEGRFEEAYQAYRQATQIDTRNPEGFQGMGRIRGILHEKAKAIYTEAILVESYGDFNSAKALYQKCLQIAPEKDLYQERCQRKKALYFEAGEVSSPNP